MYYVSNIRGGQCILVFTIYLLYYKDCSISIVVQTFKLFTKKFLREFQSS